MRQYRLEKEKGKGDYNFEMGAPDVSGLDGSERLVVMRKYRQWQMDQDNAALKKLSAENSSLPAGYAIGHRDDADKPAPTPKAMPMPPTFDTSTLSLALPSDENAAGNTSPRGPPAGVASDLMIYRCRMSR